MLIGSLLNLAAVTAAARERGEDVAILCAGYKGAFALDDAYCAGRIVQLLDGERTDAAVAAEVLADAYPNALAGLNARTYGPPGLEEDIAFCAQESVLEVVPRFAGMQGLRPRSSSRGWSGARPEAARGRSSLRRAWSRSRSCRRSG